MRLTRYTDYSLRVLVYVGARPHGPCSIASIAKAYSISRNHLVKVVHQLVTAGYLESVRGRHGGVRLARAAADICVGEVVRKSEDSLRLADCEHCVIAPACTLQRIFDEALAAFLATLDRYSVADLLQRPNALLRLLDGPRPVRAALH